MTRQRRTKELTLVTAEMDKSVHTAFLLTKLFEPENRRLIEQLGNLCQKNAKFSGPDDVGFSLNGIWYCPPTDSAFYRSGGKRGGPIHESLVPEAQAWLLDSTKVAEDMNRVRSGLYTMVSRVQDIQQLRDAIPDFIIHLHPELAKVSRFNPEFSQIADNPHLMRNIQKTIGLMQAYSVASMLY